MKKVTITYREPTIGKDETGKTAIVYTETTETYVVASTKSENNLIDELKSQNKIASKTETENVFLDKAELSKLITEYVNKAVTDKTIQKAVTTHAISALDGACLFERPATPKASK